MIFSNDIEKICAHCERGKPICGTDDVICPKKGLVKGYYHCSKFLYTPLRRTPPKPMQAKRIELPKLED